MESRSMNIDGLSIYVDRPERTEIFHNDRKIDGLLINQPDHTGIPSISFPWKRLEYPNGIH